MNRTLAALLLLLAILAAMWVNGRQPAPIPLTPTLTGETEYCLTCHSDVTDISASHPTAVFGCVKCHGGERLALDADLAHSSMRGGANPSDLSVVEASCGGSECHSGTAEDGRDHIQRVQTSVQATYASAIAAVRYSFGAQADATAHLGITAVQDKNVVSETAVPALDAFDPSQETHPSILAFSENCLTCHLSAQPLPGADYDRFTGCAACHTHTTNRLPDEPVHELTTAVSYSQCNTCHNRGNSSLRDMQFHGRTDQPTGRQEDYYQPIGLFTQCEWELDCIDCHTRNESMGDGDIYSSQADIQYVQCQTCHGSKTEPPLTKTITDPDDIALRLAALNPVLDLKVGDTIVITEQGEPLWNIRQLDDGSLQMIGKVTKLALPVALVMDSDCQQNPDEQESHYCHECHAVQH
jgi:hypothetical protein